MIPYSDGIAPRRFPVVNVALIVANFAVFLFYELPNGEAAVNQASFYPCDAYGTARGWLSGARHRADTRAFVRPRATESHLSSSK